MIVFFFCIGNGVCCCCCCGLFLGLIRKVGPWLLCMFYRPLRLFLGPFRLTISVLSLVCRCLVWVKKKLKEGDDPQVFIVNDNCRCMNFSTQTCINNITQLLVTNDAFHVRNSQFFPSPSMSIPVILYLASLHLVCSRPPAFFFCFPSNTL